MRIKRLGETFGLGFTWHSATRTLLVSFLVWAWSFRFPKIGSCKECGHDWPYHMARRDHKAIQWVCMFKSSSGAGCECEHYDPIVKNDKPISHRAAAQEAPRKAGAPREMAPRGNQMGRAADGSVQFSWQKGHVDVRDALAARIKGPGA